MFAAIMPSSLCSFANKIKHVASFELFVLTSGERQIPRITGIVINAAHNADVTRVCTCRAECDVHVIDLSMRATTGSPDTATVRSRMLMINLISLTRRRVLFASAVPEQEKVITSSGSAARTECPGSSRRPNKTVAAIRSITRQDSTYGSRRARFRATILTLPVAGS